MSSILSLVMQTPRSLHLLWCSSCAVQSAYMIYLSGTLHFNEVFVRHVKSHVYLSYTIPPFLNYMSDDNMMFKKHLELAVILPFFLFITLKCFSSLAPLIIWCSITSMKTEYVWGTKHCWRIKFCRTDNVLWNKRVLSEAKFSKIHVCAVR